ncbi:MAG: flagellar motor switch protein FliN [Candidatus Latescibacterota bacterium]|nr:flagellar motor switch protein FliN [Candidatus Latescibacterota bacterium]
MAEEDETSEDELSSDIENDENPDEANGGGETSADESDSDGDSDASSSEESALETEMLAALEDGGDGGIGDEVTSSLTDANAAIDRSAMPVNVARLMDVDLNVTIELGRSRQTMQSVLGLGEQSVVELDKQVGESVDVLVNGKLFARGEVVTVSENFGVRITEILGNVADL